MAKIKLHPDFKEFLKLLKAHEVKYLLVGGYAVGYHGYPRATGDIDIWSKIGKKNARRMAAVFRDFGLPEDTISEELFLSENKVIRIGVPPVRLEVLTSASGVKFDACYPNREIMDLNGIPVHIISLEDLKKNKRAAGQHKDLEDVAHLA